MGILDVFSKRHKKLAPDVFQYEKLPEPFRVQVVHILEEGFPDVDPSSYRSASQGTMRERFVPGLVQGIRHEMGVLHLTHPRDRDPFMELANFVLKQPKTEWVLTAIEVSFRLIAEISATPHFQHVGIDALALIADLNHRFREHGIGYQYEGKNIVPVSNAHVHAEAVRPALEVLSDPMYAGADEEFRKAFEHFRKGDNKACLVECLKAFESAMKSICDKRRWKYEKTAAAKQLIKVVLDNRLLSSDLAENQLSAVRQQLETGVPTVRNKLGGHGQGSKKTEAPDFLAKYVLNLTATTILLLVEAEKAL